jgi:hypothetical protein
VGGSGRPARPTRRFHRDGTAQQGVDPVRKSGKTAQQSKAAVQSCKQKRTWLRATRSRKPANHGRRANSSINDKSMMKICPGHGGVPQVPQHCRPQGAGMGCRCHQHQHLDLLNSHVCKRQREDGRNNGERVRAWLRKTAPKYCVRDTTHRHSVSSSRGKEGQGQGLLPEPGAGQAMPAPRSREKRPEGKVSSPSIIIVMRVNYSCATRSPCLRVPSPPASSARVPRA